MKRKLSEYKAPHLGMTSIYNMPRFPGESKQTCCTDINSNSIIAQFFAKYEYVDQLISEQATAQGVSCICKKGCKDCCYEYFYFSMAEYFAIRHELVKQGKLEQIMQKGKPKEST